MVVLECARALLPEGWRADVTLEIGPEGRIERVGTEAGGSPATRRLDGLVVPGMPNLHSHAFQRGLAGRTEHAAPGRGDSFWSWREAMYGLAEALSLEALEALAELVYVEMLEAGYTSVGEFHYLHHGAGGRALASPAAAMLAVSRAAARAGLGFTALPVLYLHGGFSAPPAPRQARFVSRDVQAFLRIFDDARAGLGPGQRIGVAPHSLRAVDLEAMAELLGEVEARQPGAPVHVHVAEQPAEVEACLAALGRRPVEALLERFDVGPRWCLVHATHATKDELREVAARGAVIGLCPTTEANLGDGCFLLDTFLELGGRFGVGTDSQATVDPAEELRWLEYQARLRTGRRNVLALDGAPPRVGLTLWGRAMAGGAAALGGGPAGLAVGARAELVELDPENPRLLGLDPEESLDGWILGGAKGAVRSVWVGGEEVVRGGLHHRRAEVLEAFRRAFAGPRS